MKNKNMLFMIIGITFLVVGIICVCLFFSFGKNEKVDPPKKDDKEQTKVKAGYDEFGNQLLVVYETKEEVYDVITNNYLKKGETISPAREENGCWYYMSSNGMDEYEYCINDPIIRVKTTYEIDLNDIKN